MTYFRAIFVWPWKLVSVSVRYLFYEPMDEKIKTCTLHFPAKENPNMEKALFDWSIVSQYEVKAKYRLISRKFLGMKFFHPSVCLTNQKLRTFVSVRQTSQITLFSFVCCFCRVRAFSFQGHSKIFLTQRVSKARVVFGVTTQTLENFTFQDEDDYENEILFSILVVRVREQASFWRENYRFHREYRSGGNKLQMLCIFCARDREKA